MQTFIHTFSISVDITYEEAKRFYGYKWIPLENSYKGKRYCTSIIEFCSRGLQIQIIEKDEREVKYDKKHYPLRADFIVTLYRLLYPGTNLGKITGLDELIKALEVSDALIEQIEKEIGISIKNNYKIRRVDITCDVVTPNDDYSRDIIAASKVSKLPYGYKRSEPSLEDIERFKWKKEDGSLFYNENQAIYAKIYNKKENLRGKKEYEDCQNKGLIRYEIELTRRFLKKAGMLQDDILGKCLAKVMNTSQEILKKYFVLNTEDLPMFSRRVLNQFISIEYAGKKKTLCKLKMFYETAYSCKKRGEIFDAEHCNLSLKEFNACYRKFVDINISPVPAEDICPYIPSVEQMLEGTIDRKFLRYAEKKTRGKEMWFI